MPPEHSPPPLADRARSIAAEAAERRDRAELWPHAWQMACRRDTLVEIGDFCEYEIAGRSLIVILAESGVKAFHNRCTHRGVRIISGEGNCRTGLSCPFHGWQWTIDGRNTFFLRQHLANQKDRKPETLDLQPCRVEVIGAHIFVNPDDAALPLSQAAGAAILADHADRATCSPLLGEVSVVLPTDWRAALRLVRAIADGTPPVADADIRQAFQPCLDLLDAFSPGDTVPVPASMPALPNVVALPLGDRFAAIRARPIGPFQSRLDVWIHGPTRRLPCAEDPAGR